MSLVRHSEGMIVIIVVVADEMMCEKNSLMMEKCIRVLLSLLLSRLFRLECFHMNKPTHTYTQTSSQHLWDYDNDDDSDDVGAVIMVMVVVISEFALFLQVANSVAISKTGKFLCCCSLEEKLQIIL